MSKLHELLAAERTPNAAFNQVFEETIKKFKNPVNYYVGFSKSLAMIEDTPQNKAIEAQAREEREVVTNVYDTLDYTFDLFAKAEDLQFQKNCTNAVAKTDLVFRGLVLAKNVPVDELLGLESRIGKIRNLFVEAPTLDASKRWTKDLSAGANVYRVELPEETTKTEKVIVPVVLQQASDKHPAQVQAVPKDVVVGKFTTILRSGAITAAQKAESIKMIDELLVEIKRARMRANETEVVNNEIGNKLKDLLLSNLK